VRRADDWTRATHSVFRRERHDRRGTSRCVRTRARELARGVQGLCRGASSSTCGRLATACWSWRTTPIWPARQCGPRRAPSRLLPGEFVRGPDGRPGKGDRSDAPHWPLAGRTSPR